MEYILQLESLDDMASIRGRIDRVLPVGETVLQTRRRLLLVIPDKNTAMQKLVNMKLLARVADNKVLEIALVTDQPVVRDYAREVGFKVFGSIRAAKRSRWISDGAPVALSNQTLPPVLSPQPIETETSRLSQKQTRIKRYKVVTGSGIISWWHQGMSLVLTGLLAIAFVLGVVFLLPQATVTLTPVARTVTTDLIVQGDPAAKAVDFETLTFPARVAQVELSLVGKVDTIEAEFAPAGFASGMVTIINKTDVSQTVPPSTTLTTSSGEYVEFSTLITVEVPGQIDGIATVSVIATEPGPIGNVGVGQVSRFLDPQYSVDLRAINQSSFGGGTYELTRIVVNDDKDRLREHLIQEMHKEGLKRLQESLGKQEFISPDTIQVIPLALTFKEFSGDFSDTFSGDMQAVVRGTVVGGYNANQLALVALETQVPDGFKLDAKGLHFGAGEVLKTENGVVSFRIIASGLIVPEIDPHQVAQEVAWLSIGEAQNRLAKLYDLATVPGVELEPAWLISGLGRLPYSSVRVDVIIKDAVTLLPDGEK
jgi:hypothetical protein